MRIGMTSIPVCVGVRQRSEPLVRMSAGVVRRQPASIIIVPSFRRIGRWNSLRASRVISSYVLVR